MDDFDRIMNMSEAELDAMIRAEGGDPADYAMRGRQAAERALLTVQTFKAAQADLSIVKHQHALALQFTVGGLSFVIGDAPQTYDTLSFRMMQFRKALCQLMEAARTAGVKGHQLSGNPGQLTDEELADCGLLSEMGSATAGVRAAQTTSDGERALDLLDTLFTAYEDGPDCYEDPEDFSGHVGKAVKLDEETFHACADLLNRTRPRGANSTDPHGVEGSKP